MMFDKQPFVCLTKKTFKCIAMLYEGHECSGFHSVLGFLFLDFFFKWYVREITSHWPTEVEESLRIDHLVYWHMR